MNELSTQDLAAAVAAMAEAIEAKKDWLCELDGAIGDADHGVTMSVGFAAVNESIKNLPAKATPTDLLNQSAKAFLSAMGGSAGPLYATALMRAGAGVKGRSSLDAAALGAVVVGMADGIMARGKAQAGEKTMLDAWLPARKAAEDAIARGADMASLSREVAQAAQAGADSTIAMQATKGRSSRLGERSVGHMDPGAASTSVMLEALAQFVATD